MNSLAYIVDDIKNEKEWIVVNNTALRALGYKNVKDIDNKKKYKRLLQANFPNQFEEILRSDTRSKQTPGRDRTLIAVIREAFIKSLNIIDTQESIEFSKNVTPTTNSMDEVNQPDKINVEENANLASFNNIPLSIDDNKELSLMNIYDFVLAFQYDIDKLYIDKFWNEINDDVWIVVDRHLLRWIGYNSAKDIENKRAYFKLIKNNFTKGNDYDVIQPTKFDSRTNGPIELKNTIIISTKSFEMSLMMVRTQKAASIRKYFQVLGRIMKDYMIYTKYVNSYNLQIENKQLKCQALEYKRLVDTAQEMFDIDVSPLCPTEYVYILTSQRYYRKSIFKIGKSVKPNKRIISHNTTAATDDDAMFYTHVIPTLDCGALEKTLHALLVRYHHTKEWYKLPHSHLLDIIRIAIDNQSRLIDEVNRQLQHGQFDTFTPIPLDKFMDSDITNIDLHVVKSPRQITNTMEVKQDFVEPTNENNQPNDNMDNDIIQRKGIFITCGVCQKKFISRTRATTHIQMCHQ